MHLMYYLDDNGNRVYTLKVCTCCVTIPVEMMSYLM
jgi:hypothetical protein